MDSGSSPALRRTRMFVSILRIVVLLALAFPAATSVRAAGPWYVAPAGNDSNSCTSPGAPCLTINGAIGKAAAGDTIKVAIGTYTSQAQQVVLVDRNVSLLGGWDGAFTSQSGLSTIDGEEARRAVFISSGVIAQIDRFLIQHGAPSWATSGGAVYGFGSLTLSNSIVTENAVSSGAGVAIIHNLGATLTINNSTVRDNDGQGISNYYGSVTLNNSTVSGNWAGMGTQGGSLTLNNSTVSNNNGTGIGNWTGSLNVNNSTITGNVSQLVAAGITSDLGTVKLRNTILAGNASLSGYPDCYGDSTFTSLGYNLVGNNAGCNFVAATGDQVGTADNPIDPRLGPLADNGGPAYTHGLAEDSPALNAGNPAAPGSGDDACLATDQRGVARPVDGVCDIGAFEGSVTVVKTTWYVAKTGNDSNSCMSSAAPCLTINAAIEKAIPGDIIRVAIGTYTGGGPEVVLVNKNLSLLGGWNAAFTAQTGVSTVEGEQARRGIIIDTARTVEIERFRVQNGFHTWTGGGIYNSGFLTLKGSLASNNFAQDGGGGIRSDGVLKLNDSTIRNNSAGGSGGAGIWSFNGTLTLNNSTVNGNTSIGSSPGSAIFANGTVILNNSTISGNTGAAAISTYAYVTVSNTTIADNPLGGIIVDFDAARLRNSIVARNTSGGGKDCSGAVASAGYNLIGDVSGCTFTPAAGDQVGTSTHPINPRLGPLANNGGPTLTRALLGGSPALNAGNPAAPGSGGDACLATDQRGVARPFGSACDVGAYEADILLVQSVRPANLNPTSAYTVNFTVKFNEAVTGVNKVVPFSDFALATTGLTGAAITAVTGTGDTYNVKVNVGSGTGTVRLDVLDDDTILDLSGHPLGGPGAGNGGFTGPAYTIVNPRVTSIFRASPSPTSAFSVKFNVKFSEPVTGVNKTAPFSDFALLTTGVTGAAITGVSGTGTSYVVTVKTGQGNGALQLKVVDDDSLLSKFGRPLGGPGVGNGNFTGPAYTVRKIPTILAPVGTSTWDRTPTYKWSKIPAATQYSYQLWKGATLVSTRTVPASSCTATASCLDTPTTLLLPAAYKWRVRAAASGTWLPFSAYKTFTILGPKAGYWRSDWTDFYITPDRANVQSFSIYITVYGCGNYKITHTVLAPVIDRKFSFSGHFYARGLFATTGLSASGNAGLSSFPIPGCGYVSGGPFPWTATWISSSQTGALTTQEVLLLPGVEGTFFGPFTVEPVEP